MSIKTIAIVYAHRDNFGVTDELEEIINESSASNDI